MVAMLAYRTRFGFERKFDRKTLDNVPQSLNRHLECLSLHGTTNNPSQKPVIKQADRISTAGTQDEDETVIDTKISGPESEQFAAKDAQRAPTYFSVQSYLRYQARKFVNRFDANCYLAITRKLDTHDISRGRSDTIDEALQSVKQKALIIGVESDVLYTFNEQAEMHRYIQNSRFNVVVSVEGHDGFLLEATQMSSFLTRFQIWALPEYYPHQSISRLNKESDIEAEDEEFTSARTCAQETRQPTVFKEDGFMN